MCDGHAAWAGEGGGRGEIDMLDGWGREAGEGHCDCEGGKGRGVCVGGGTGRGVKRGEGGGAVSGR